MIEATIARDSEGFPSLVTLQDGAKRLEVAFDRDSGFTISGSRRSFTTELLDVLRMIYPATIDFKMDIPQPLQVQNVAGGDTLLFDDMEALMKWEQSVATVALDNAFAWDGSQSLILTGALGAAAQARRYFGFRDYQKLSLSFMFCIQANANLTELISQLYFYGQGGLSIAQFIYTPATYTWRLDVPGGDVNVITVPGGLLDLEGVGGPWHYVQMDIDLKNKMYTGFRVNWQKWTGELPYQFFPGAAENFGRITLVADAAAGVDCSVWYDNVLLIGRSD